MTAKDVRINTLPSIDYVFRCVAVGSIDEKNLERIVQVFTHPFLFCTV